MLVGRLGLDKARVPHADRHGVIYLDRGRLEVEDGCLRFVTAGGGALAAGDYQLPHQSVSIVLIGPGSSVTHDALRILAAHGCALAAVGSGGVRFYTAPPLLPDTSTLARRQVMLWSQPSERIAVARAMYTLRFGEEVKARTLDMLRGMEGARLKRLYELTAQQFGVAWNGRRYDRNNPNRQTCPIKRSTMRRALSKQQQRSQSPQPPPFHSSASSMKTAANPLCSMLPISSGTT